MGKKRTARGTKRTAQEASRRRHRQWRVTFLAELEKTRNVTRACERARVKRTYVYEVKAEDAAFSDAWDKILNTRVTVLEDSMFERATVGVRRRVWQGGKLMGIDHVPSDSLAQFLARAWAPDRYNLTPGDGAASSVSARQTALEIRQALQEMDAAAAPAAVGGIAATAAGTAGGVQESAGRSDGREPDQRGGVVHPPTNGGGDIQAEGPP